MSTPQPLRSELASVCSFLALKRPASAVREAPRGILAQLAAGKGRQ